MMGRNTVLSIIIPVYNAEKYLDQCISSILHQSLQHIEIILVDDGSTDASQSICDKYADIDTRVRVCRQENKGVIEARYAGLKLSSGNYVTFADADDFVEQDAYINALNSMDSDVDVVCFGITRFFQNRDCKTEYSPFEEGRYDKSAIEEIIYPHMIWDRDKKRMDPSLCTKIMKRDILLKAFSLIPNRNFYYGEDAAVIYPFFKMVHSLEIINCSYYYHRQRKTGKPAPYIKDSSFFDKLYVLYSYLKSQFEENKVVVGQIEHFYIDSVNLRKKVYNDYGKEICFLFPFHQIEKGEKIVLYGAGIVGQTYYEQLQKIPYCELVLWVDKDYETYKQYGVVAVKNIQNIEFDKVVIAIKNEEISQDVQRVLIEMGIAQHRIVTMDGEGKIDD